MPEFYGARSEGRKSAGVLPAFSPLDSVAVEVMGRANVVRPCPLPLYAQQVGRCVSGRDAAVW